MTVCKHAGILWGILVSSFTGANDLEENDWRGAAVKQEKQPACCLWIPSVTTELCYDVTPCALWWKRRASPLDAQKALFCSLRWPQEAEKEISLSVSLARQNSESVPLLSGLGIMSPPFTVVFICNMEGLRRKHRVISLRSLLQPSPGFWRPHFVTPLLSVSQLWNGGLSHNYYTDRPFGLTKMAAS